MKVKNAVGQLTGMVPEVDLVCEQIRRSFIATMRERIHGVWLVCRKRARGNPLVVNCLLQTRKMLSIGGTWSVAGV